MLDDLVAGRQDSSLRRQRRTNRRGPGGHRHPGVQTVQIIFNMFRQRPAEVFFPEAQRREVGILARVPLASGLLTGKLSATINVRGRRSSTVQSRRRGLRQGRNVLGRALRSRAARGGGPAAARAGRLDDGPARAAMDADVRRGQLRHSWRTNTRTSALERGGGRPAAARRSDDGGVSQGLRPEYIREHVHQLGRSATCRAPAELFSDGLPDPDDAECRNRCSGTPSARSSRTESSTLSIVLTALAVASSSPAQATPILLRQASYSDASSMPRPTARSPGSIVTLFGSAAAPPSGTGALFPISPSPDERRWAVRRSRSASGHAVSGGDEGRLHQRHERAAATERQQPANPGWPRTAHHRRRGPHVAAGGASPEPSSTRRATRSSARASSPSRESSWAAGLATLPARQA